MFKEIKTDKILSAFYGAKLPKAKDTEKQCEDQEITTVVDTDHQPAVDNW